MKRHSSQSAIWYSYYYSKRRQWYAIYIKKNLETSYTFKHTVQVNFFCNIQKTYGYCHMQILDFACRLSCTANLISFPVNIHMKSRSVSTPKVQAAGFEEIYTQPHNQDNPIWTHENLSCKLKTLEITFGIVLKQINSI